MGLLMFPNPVATVPMAKRVENLGFDSFVLADTQCLTPEVWSHLMLVATATERMEIGTGVTNPVSRDPAVTASAALGVQHASGGRVVVGIGRGDSSMAKIGRRPAPPAVFERYLEQLRACLHGQEVHRACEGARRGVHPPLRDRGSLRRDHDAPARDPGHRCRLPAHHPRVARHASGRGRPIDAGPGEGTGCARGGSARVAGGSRTTHDAKGRRSSR